MTNARSDGIRTIINSSRARKDRKAEDLEALLEADEQLVIQDGNIITNVISNKPTPLQVALSVLLSKKTLIEELHYFRVGSSYDEYLRFKASAAKAAEGQIDLRGLLSAKEGIIQVVAHNFDSNISSQNGLLSTHKLRLALLLTLREEKKSLEAEEGATNRRVSRDEARHQITHEVSAEIPRTQKASSACHRSKACCSAPESTG